MTSVKDHGTRPWHLTLAPLSGFELPLVADGAAEQLVGLVVIDELFLDRIPLQLLAAQAQGDHPNVADRRRTVSNLRRADTRLARPDAVQPVAHVVRGGVQPHRVRGQRLVEDARGAALLALLALLPGNWSFRLIAGRDQRAADE